MRLIKSALPKLMVTGHGRHGKDTFCEIMRPWKFVSSSLFVAHIAVYPSLKTLYNYESLSECYNDRHNHRAEWHKLISAYNSKDLPHLARELYYEYDIYCGLRCQLEFKAAQKEGLFALSIWVDASERVPPESTDSCTITKRMCDIVIENNGTLEDLEKKVSHLKVVLLGNS